MRICMFGRSIAAHSTGGMESHIETLTRELVKLGVDVTVITTANPDGTEYEERSGVKIHYLKGTFPGGYSRAYYARSIDKFIELNSKERFDLIHSQSAGAYGILSKGVNKKLNVPAVVTLHGTSIDEIKTKLRLGFNLRANISVFKNIYDYLFQDKKYMNAADRIIAISDSQVRTIQRYFGIKADKITLIYNGIDDQMFTPRVLSDEMTALYGVRRGDAVIAAAARLKKEKGIQNIISAFPQIKKSVPNAKLIVAGGGEYRRKLEKLVKKLELNSEVKFLGNIEYKNMPDFLNCSKVFVNSTIRVNGYDLIMPQAMACAKPVVATDIPSVFSLIESGRTGLIYKRGDLDELASLVVKILSDDQLQENIGRASRKAVEEKYNLPRMAEKTLEVYKKVSGGA